jgi:hypothetical protein
MPSTLPLLSSFVVVVALSEGGKVAFVAATASISNNQAGMAYWLIGTRVMAANWNTENLLRCLTVGDMSKCDHEETQRCRIIWICRMIQYACSYTRN